ncbi:MAG: histone H1 [Saprospiraceae bacterium]
MSKIFESIKQTIAEAEADVQKFNAGNNAAGGRVRKAMQDLKNLAQDMRKEVLDVKNSRTAK